ncbi:hypothetical protein [Geosporobacter ferrireducens]|uniref:hypothetical protein n=1 Tax=Geosporobacter ferrireducens TaxID=1424294 RepID=UPI00139C8E63|nr:hypothetical protein [Geosporobacter ferrireducens]MTI57724.1 hypothetical protein [Geosporobacter ferrireducens]
MRIRGVNSNYLYSYQPIQNDKVKKEGDFQINNIEKSSKINESNDVYKELSGKYDIRNVTFKELTEITDKLFEAVEITLFEHSLLTLDLSKLPVPDGMDNTYLLNKYSDTHKQDWIAIFEDSAKTCWAHGDINSYSKDMNIVKVLNRLAR